MCIFSRLKMLFLRRLRFPLIVFTVSWSPMNSLPEWSRNLLRNAKQFVSGTPAFHGIERIPLRFSRSNLKLLVSCHSFLLLIYCKLSVNFLTACSMNVGLSQASLIAVVGRVGDGKSNLLSSILGEMHKLKGNITINVSCISKSFLKPFH